MWWGERSRYPRFIATLDDRILVRLDNEFLRSVSEVNEALGQTRGVKPVRSPGVEETEKGLRRLQKRGLVEEVSGRWRQTPAGAAEDSRLESLFDNSGGYGDYGL